MLLTSHLKRAAITLALCAVSTWVAAHSFTVGKLLIEHPYALPSVFAAQNGAAYIRSIANKSDIPDQLISASTPAAGSVEIHTMKMDGDIMRMREIGTLPLPANTETFLRHDERGANGYHLMLMKLVKPLNEGDRFPMTLKFEKAGVVEVVIVVQKSKSDAAVHKH
jgi:periplasmic copper chaperone A